MLEGKAVVVTGAGRGIGAACAAGVGRQGARVVVNDVDAEEAEQTARAIKAQGGTAISCVADISDWEQAGKLIEACISAFGRIDGLVNNAALYHIGRVDAFNPLVARALVEVNVLGPMYCTGHAVKAMLAQRSGSIVNVVSGAHMGMPGMGIYGATKGAVASMVYTWAMELSGSGVRVNALSPFGATNILGNSNRQLRQRYGIDTADFGEADNFSRNTAAGSQFADCGIPPLGRGRRRQWPARPHRQGRDPALHASGPAAAVGEARALECAIGCAGLRRRFETSAGQVRRHGNAIPAGRTHQRALEACGDFRAENGMMLQELACHHGQAHRIDRFAWPSSRTTVSRSGPSMPSGPVTI